MIAVYHKVKSGKLELLKSWGRCLNTTLRDEAEATLHDERVTVERMVLLDNGDIKIETDVDAEHTDLTKTINKIHKYFLRECLIPKAGEPGEDVEVIYSLHVRRP